MMNHNLSTYLLFGLVFFLISCEQETDSNRVSYPTPEQELAGFSVPEGFTVELVASEKDGVVNPIDLTFDDAGRLWTQTARMYPLDPVKDIKWNDLMALMDDPGAQRNHPEFKKILDLYEGKTKGEDDILILSNLFEDKPVKVTKWADGLAIPQSILPYKNGAYVAQGSELFFLSDEDNDGKADQRIRLFTGFGFTDTHTMAHTLIRGPGAWIHFSHGALNKGRVKSLKSDAELDINYSKIARFSLDGKRIELVNAGLNNIWGFQLRHNGQWYGSEANDMGYSSVPMEPGTAFPGIGNERIRPYQPWMPPLHDFRVGGTGISGLAFSEDSNNYSFPKSWNNVALLANPITSKINAVRIKRNPDGSVKAEHLPDFLTSEDKYFRPVNMEFGPDGCLYIADWYNKIISHNEVPTSHPDRDKSHGRIWRVCHESQQQRTIPNFYDIPTVHLVDYLTSPSLWEKRSAWHQITDRPISETKQLIPELVELASDASQDEITRIHALWSLEGVSHYDADLISTLLTSSSGNLRREAVRSLASFSLSPNQVADHLQVMIDDDNAMVRSQVLRTLSEIDRASQASIDIMVRASKPEVGWNYQITNQQVFHKNDIDGNTMGGPYERSFERYLARKALEQYPGQLQTYLDSEAALKVPAENLLWVSQALPNGLREKAFLELWPKAGTTKLNAQMFISIAQMLNNKEIYEIVKPVLQNPDNATLYTEFAIKYQPLIQSPEFTNIMRDPVESLLHSASELNVHLALNTIGRYGMEGFYDDIESVLDRYTSEQTLALALDAMDSNPKANQEFFTRIVGNENVSFDIRTNALNSLVKANPERSSTIVRELLNDLTDDQKNDLINVLSTSNQGSQLLVSLYEDKALDINAFDLAAAERINQLNSGPQSLAILEAVQKREQQNKEEIENKLARYLEIVESNTGNTENGKILFQTCLTCHPVGNQGQNIAPALDGSAYRETEALLTAILDPSAAVESGYQMYRVTQKDGGIVEGYLVESNDQGTRIAFMGGATVYIEKESIKSEGYISGRSFMPEGLIEGYTDQEVADLVSYIRTLK